MPLDYLDTDLDVLRLFLDVVLSSEDAAPDWDESNRTEAISIDDMRAVDSLGESRGDREHSFSSPLTKTGASAHKDGCTHLFRYILDPEPAQVCFSFPLLLTTTAFLYPPFNFLFLNMHAERAFILVAGQHIQVADFGFNVSQANADECGTWCNTVTGQSMVSGPSTSGRRHSSHASIRDDLAGGCCLDTEDSQLSRNHAAATGVAAARNSHDRHAHAYRQTHEGRELRSVPQVCDFRLSTITQ